MKIINKEEQNYLDLRNCGSTLVLPDVVDEIGWLCNPSNCKSDIIWFSDEDDDFNIITFEPGTISFETSDVEGDDTIKQISVDRIESWERPMEIQHKYGGKMLNFIFSILMNESNSGRDGAGLVAYANGGIYTRRTWTFNKGEVNEFSFQEVVPNMKLTEFPDVYSGQIKSDTVVTLPLIIQDYPQYYTSGNIPLQMWFPNDVVAPVLSDYTAILNDDSFTLGDIEITDTDNVIDNVIDKPLLLQIYSNDVDSTTGTYPLISSQNFASGEEVTINNDFSAYDNISYTLTLFICETINFPVSGQKIDKTIPLLANGNFGVNGTSTTTSVNGVYTYLNNSEDFNLGKIEIVETSSPLVIIDTIQPISAVPNTLFEFTGLTAGTSYTINLYQDSTILDTVESSTLVII